MSPSFLAAAVAAIVALLALLISLAFCRSMLDYSTRLMEMGLNAMQSGAREAERDRRLSEMTAQLEKLDATVGNVFAMTMRSSGRTVLERAAQHGEVPPGTPGKIKSWNPESKVEPEGLTDSPAKNAGELVRARAFAEPT